MSDSHESHALDSSFSMDDYLEATKDAASRTRTTAIVLVVASVLISIGWYNSLRWSWPLYRVRQAYGSDQKYVKAVLDYDNHPDLFKKEEGADEMSPTPSVSPAPASVTTPTYGEGEKDGIVPAQKFRSVLREEALKAYIDNVRFIRVPFFGIAFDANDLGLIGGVALIIILLVMRYSLSREIKNLNVSLREAVHHDRLPVFYHALAMRQVFTVPHMKGEKRNRWLAVSPRIICILPAFVFLLGVTYDYYTTLGPNPVLFFREVTVTLIIETIWLVLIIYLAVRCWERQSHIDSVWEQHWNKIEGQRSTVIRLKKDLVQGFGSDDDVDRALRRFRVEAWDANNPF